MSKGYIYMLLCPITKSPMYIGTSINPLRRYGEHLTVCSITTVRIWITTIYKYNQIPILEILDECEEHESNFWESYYICLYFSWGFNLLNYNRNTETVQFLADLILHYPSKRKLLKKYRERLSALNPRPVTMQFIRKLTKSEIYDKSMRIHWLENSLRNKKVKQYTYSPPWQ